MKLVSGEYMKKEQVKVGMYVDAKSEEELKKPFQGKVEKIYENSALLQITAFAPEDKDAVNDLNSKMVVNFKNLTKAKNTIRSRTAATNDVKIEKIAIDNKKEQKKSKNDKSK